MNEHDDQDDKFEAELLVREDDTLDGAAILRLLDKPLSPDDLRDATERVARPLEIAEKDVVRMLVFRAAEELMAFESFLVNQVTRATAVHRIPHRSNKTIRGLCNLDGELLLCANLAQLLELNEPSGAADPSSKRMVVLGDEQTRWVVEVDAILGVFTGVRSAFRRPPITVDAALARYTSALVPLEQGEAALIDVERLLSGFQGALR